MLCFTTHKYDKIQTSQRTENHTIDTQQGEQDEW